MSIASLERAPVGSGARVGVLGGDPAMRRQAAEPLVAAGFTIVAQPEPGTVVVLLSRERDLQRVQEVRALATAHPEVHVLAVMTMDAPNAALRKALIAGARGIVLEPELEDALAPTVRAIAAGQLAVPSRLGRQIAPRPLSHREKQILSLVVLGLTNREIAHRLYLAESTIKTHLSSAFRKIDARSRAEAVARLQDPELGYGMVLLTPAQDVAVPAA